MKKIIDRFKEHYAIGVTFIAVLFVLVIGLVFRGNKATFSLEETLEDTVSITCDNPVKVDEEFKCQVKLNVTSFAALSLNAKYDLPEGIDYVSFESGLLCENEDDCVFEANETAFAAGDINGLDNDRNIGTLTLKVSGDFESNETFNIGFKEIEVTDKNDGIDYLTKTLEDVVTSIRVASSINTIDKLIISVGSEDYNIGLGEKTSYEMTVGSNDDSVKIDYTTTDSNVIVSGNIGQNLLNYGTNKLIVTVTAEDGVSTQEYIISIYRPYELSTEHYVYDKDGNYIYVGQDEDSVVYTNLGLPEGLSAKIEDNKLIISNVNEELLSIDIIRFSLTNAIVEDTIYIETGLTYDDFVDKIDLNSSSMSIKVIDADGNEITGEGVITDGNKLNIYYNQELIDTYSFKVEYLEFDPSLVVDSENKVISRLVVGMSFSQLREKILTSGDISFVSNDENTITDDDIIKSGDKLIIKLSEVSYTYTLLVLGDVNGDGKITLGDVSTVYKHQMGRQEMDENMIPSADIIDDGNIALGDVSRLYKKFMGRIASLKEGV